MSEKKLIFSGGGCSYCSDYTWCAADRSHLGADNPWKVEDGIVYWQYAHIVGTSEWHPDELAVQLAYQQYLSRLITDEQ